MSHWIAGADAAALDNPRGRGELARLATAAARAAVPGLDIEVFWDGVWIRRVGPHFFPDPGMFQIAEPNWQRWANLAEKFLRDAGDYWFHVYKPVGGDAIVDIGAGRGEDVFAFSRAVGPAGRVFAVEPHPVSFQALRKFCEWNRLDNVTTVQCACIDETADLEIETLPVWESNYVRTGEPSAASFPVKGVRFDDLSRELGIGRIDYLKMNIEGAERRALPGCRGALGRTRFVTIAAHDFRADRGEGEHFRTLELVRRFLLESGFRLTTRDSDPRYYVPYHVHGSR
jgi:FkbM family methyltransferase